MRNYLAIALSCAIAIFLTGCKQDTPESPESYYSCFAKTSLASGLDYVLENGQVLHARNNINNYIPRDGKRVWMVFYTTESMDQDEVNISIYQIDTTVRIAPSQILPSAEDVEALGDDRFEVVVSPYEPYVSPDYINIDVCYSGYQSSLHSFYLVQDASSYSMLDEYLELKLVHDAGNDAVFYDIYQWLCFPTAPFKDMFEGKSGIRIEVETKYSGTQYIILEIPD